MQSDPGNTDIQISIIIPIYNEEQVIPHLVPHLLKLISERKERIEIIFIDDGSTDKSAAQLLPVCMSDPRFQYISFSRNFGHQVALTAGLHYARAKEAVFILDADLQDPPELIGEFYQQLRDGYDIVYGIRNHRKENSFKKLLYFSFYRILNRLAVLHFPVDSGDFCLLSRKVVDIINQFPEERRFLRGIRTWVGFRQIGIPYERKARIAGNSKYSYRRLIRLAMNGIYNFSELPIRFISVLGVLAISSALIYLMVTLINKFLYHTVPQGFTALLFAIVLFSGVQLLSLGVIGEYVMRIFFQIKDRPLFIIDKKVFDKKVIDG